MRLAAEDTFLRLDGVHVTLRPTLRAAIRLERRHGFDALFRNVQDMNLSVIGDLVRESAVSESDDFEHALEWVPLSKVSDLIEPLLAHVVGLTGIDAETIGKAAEQGRDAPRMTLAEHLQKLFEIGTGWLGYSPEVTLDCTPRELLAAHKGRADMLKAIFGGSEDQKPKLSLDEKINLAVASMAGQGRA